MALISEQQAESYLTEGAIAYCGLDVCQKAATLARLRAWYWWSSAVKEGLVL